MNLRRDAVAQDIPSRRMLARKCQLLLHAETLPDALRVRAHLVHDDGGIRTQVPQASAMLLHERNELLQSERREISIHRRKFRVFDPAEMRVRHPAVARDGMDAPGPA